MTNEELQQLVSTLSKRLFKRPFRHQAYFNSRLRTTGGRYMLKSHHIDINPKYLEEFGMDELIGIIKHELCHYHLHLEGKGYKHGDKDFKDLLAEVGGPRHCSSLPIQKKRGRRLTYRCKECSLEFIRRKRVDTNRFVCGRCKGRLILEKIEEFQGS
ncbi:hypothetical protein ASG66_20675 [Bacillus sp. Leaf406]|nr:hypothetical protein ASG66_20675 [Bacillus sp. Leaf406]